MEARESEPEVELASGYMIVPWSSWDQWNFVRESLFSCSPDSVSDALRRIAAWRSRGCLPIAIQVTAAIVEIQQKDPFFREGTEGDTLNSEEMLKMLYSMAITRFVNGFVQKVSGFDNHARKHGKKSCSISEAADAIGIPRMVVDIRHESSHRELPSLPLVRLASMKALDWLKSHYWERQRSAIPDVRKEIRSRLRQMCCYIKTKQAQTRGRCVKQSGLLHACSKLSSQTTGKLLYSKSDGSHKQISKISKIIARLYSAYPKEVVSVLLEIFQMQTSHLSKGVDIDCADNSNPGSLKPLGGSVNELKVIITKLSRKRPGLLLTMLEEVFEMIEAKEAMKYGKDEYHQVLSSQYQAEICQIEHLSSLVPWLLKNLKELKDSGQIGIIDETQVISENINAAPKVSLMELLRKCLLLSAPGYKHLSDSALFLAEMMGNESLSERLKKLPLLSWQYLNITIEDSSCLESNLLQEEDSVKQAEEMLNFMKLHLRDSGSTIVFPRDGNIETKKKMWTLATSWTPCPIGMLPCPFSATAYLPVLDNAGGGRMDLEPSVNKCEVKNPATGKRGAICDSDLLENTNALKKMREMSNGIGADGRDYLATSPMEGRLLIGGVWKKVGEQELLAIESNVRILVQ